MSDYLAPFDVSAAALSAERLRFEVHLSNLANARTTRTAEGGPYRRREVVFAEVPVDSFAQSLRSVEARVAVDPEQRPQLVFDPGHPDADAQGYVALPDIDPVMEQADLVTAARSYGANLGVLRIYKDMLARAMEIGR
jgi:flagellar basal-body rod protein FlgC